MPIDANLYNEIRTVSDYMRANKQADQAAELNDLKIKGGKQEYIGKVLNMTTPENYGQVRQSLVNEGLLDDAIAPREYNEEWLNKAKSVYSSGTNTMPSAIQEYQYFSKLSPQEQEQYLLTKRSNTPLNLGSYFAERSPVTNEVTPIATINPKASEMPEFKREQEIAKAEGKGGVELKNIPKKIIAEEEAKTLTPEAMESARKAEILKEETFNIINKLLANKEGVAAASGTSGQIPFTIRDKTLDAQADLETLRSMLTIENLGIMKGVLSETDMKVLQALSAGGLKGSDETVIKNLEELAPKIEAERLRRASLLKNRQKKLTDIVPDKNVQSVTPEQFNAPQKTIVKTQTSPSTGKRKIIYSDGTFEIQ